jgi:hypothetical protein
VAARGRLHPIDLRSDFGSIEGLGEWKALAGNRRQFLRLFLMQMQIRKTKVLATS